MSGSRVVFCLNFSWEEKKVLAEYKFKTTIRIDRIIYKKPKANNKNKIKNKRQ